MNLGGDTLQPLTARLSPHMGRPSVVDCEAYPMWEAFLVKKKMCKGAELLVPSCVPQVMCSGHVSCEDLLLSLKPLVH